MSDIHVRTKIDGMKTVAVAYLNGDNGLTECRYEAKNGSQALDMLAKDALERGHAGDRIFLSGACIGEIEAPKVKRRKRRDDRDLISDWGPHPSSVRKMNAAGVAQSVERQSSKLDTSVRSRDSAPFFPV